MTYLLILIVIELNRRETFTSNAKHQLMEIYTSNVHFSEHKSCTYSNWEFFRIKLHFMSLLGKEVY